MYDQIHWWLKRWKWVNHCIENRCYWSRLTSCTWTDRWIDSLINKMMKRSLHWWCHWSRLTDWLAHQRDWLWTRHCSRLTSCMWMYDQVHWWVEWWKWIDHCIENRCHWSRLTSCTWTDRRIDSLIDRAMCL